MKRVLRSRGGLGEQEPPGRNHHDTPALDGPSNEIGQDFETRTNDCSTVPLSESVAHPMDEPTTETTSRRRLRWTNDMNIYLYRTYLKITEMETNKEPYSRKLYEAMTARFPELSNKTVQNVLDQRRQIFKQNRLPQADIIRIREEVQREIDINNADIVDQNVLDQRKQIFKQNRLPQADIIHIREELQRETDTNNTDIADQDQDQPIIVEQPHLDENNLVDIFGKNMLLYNGTNPTTRPKLPKLKVTGQTQTVIAKVNDLLSDYVEACNDIEDLHTLVYAAAMTVLENHGQMKKVSQKQSRIKSTTPAWERRIKNKIEILRKQIGKVTQAVKGTIRKAKLIKQVENITTNYRSQENKSLEEILDYMKQKLAVQANRLRRYKESQLRRLQNTQFKRDQRKFYRSLAEDPNINQNESLNQINAPTTTKMYEYWKNIWQNPVRHNTKSKWAEEERKRWKKVDLMPPISIRERDVKQAISKTASWKAPGADGVQNFWYKKLTSTHHKIAQLFSEAISEPDKIPTFMTTGITYLLPKTTPPSPEPDKYRPITCLPTIYKILTSILTEKIYTHLEQNHIMAEAQKGCRKNSQGCKEQLAIDSVIVGDAKVKKKQLFTAYIDYKKAFDSVPHTWLIEVLEIYKINPQLIILLQTLMERWKTNLSVRNVTNSPTTTSSLRIQRGIFQGDSLSALWFCMSLNPLSAFLEKDRSGYQTSYKDFNISHLLYMDDLKLFSSTEENINKLLKRTELFSLDIKMEFGLDKCRVNKMKGGKWQPTEDYPLGSSTNPQETIRGMNRDDLYKYLGFHQNRGICVKETKEALISETVKRCHQILKSKLSAKNMTTAINSYAIPVLLYSFGVINWTNTDVESINRTIRVAFTKHRAHHPRSSVERFHLPRKEGGRGVIDVRNLYYKQLHQLRQYFYTKAETSVLHKAIVQVDNEITPLNLRNKDMQPLTRLTTQAEKLEKWKGKELHGRYINTLLKQHIDEQASVEWMRSSNIFAETEGFMVAIQDQVVPTLTYKRFIIKDPGTTSTKCRICQVKDETIEHILSGCSVLAPKEYTRRHDNVARIIHQALCKRHCIIKETTPYYKYKPEAVITTDKHKIYWNRTIQSDRTLAHNRPDITISNAETKTTYLIDVSVPTASNIATKHREKIEKYLPLAQDVKETWQQDKVVIVPLVLGTMGEIPHTLHQSLKTLELPNYIYKQIQKVVILESCNIVRTVLNNNT